VWAYQFRRTTLDYDATGAMILADLTVAGKRPGRSCISTRTASPIRWMGDRAAAERYGIPRR